MAALASSRTLHISIVPPGTSHIDNVNTGAFPAESDSDLRLAATVGALSSLVLDFLAKVTGASKINPDTLASFPVPTDPWILSELAIRVARLVCITEAYALLWKNVTGETWTEEAAERNDARRRKLLVEIDAITALSFGLSADELCTIYRTQFPVLRGYENNDLYDSNGRKLPGSVSKLYRQRGETLIVAERTWVHPQSGAEYVFEFPFMGFDREQDMRMAYAHFEQVLAEKQAVELVK